MKWPSLMLFLMLTGCAHFRHVPPGQSVLGAIEPRQTIAETQPAPEVPEEPLPGGNKPNYFTLGNSLLEAGHPAEAATAFEKVVQEDPRFAEAWSNLAVAYERSGQAQKAITAFKRYKSL